MNIINCITLFLNKITSLDETVEADVDVEFFMDYSISFNMLISES